MTRPDALYLSYECSLMWLSMGLSSFFRSLSFSRMQDNKDQEIGGVGSAVGNNSPLITLLVIRQAFVSALRDVEVTD